MRRIFFIFVLCCITAVSHAQELLCNVQINTSQVQVGDKKTFEILKNAIYEFVNNRNWSNYQFKSSERIECNMNIVVSERNMQNNQIKSTLTIQVRRPVFNSNYSTNILNYIDKEFNFTYSENDALEFIENSTNANLTSVLAFYCDMILGLYFDTFSPNGGTTFFTNAQTIVSLSQRLPESGWKMGKSEKDISRYWVVDGYLKPAYKQIREVNYIYHRQGLDRMYNNAAEGRAAIIQALESLKALNEAAGSPLCQQLFLDAKRDEIINIFNVAPKAEKDKVIAIMTAIDGVNSAKYQDINKR